ncbi:dihydroorotase family protein [Candidatus Daviesbacteria bacterium]|nr:dihydroorotase family protein [Candidatus Daviesbacteria bacterium]
MSRIVKLSGLVDVHVHLREPGLEHKEDFSTGTKAAIAGGYTTVLDMPNNPRPVIDLNTLLEKIEIAEGRIYSDLGFHFGGSKSAIQFFKDVETQAFGLKIYMNQTTGPLLIENDQELDEIFSAWSKDKVVMVHAEGETLTKAINLAKKHKNKLHVCHVSLGSEIDQIKKAKKEGMDITCEVSCHHLFLTTEDTKRLGAFVIMTPPLRSKKDVEYIWKNLDVLDMIASDHAPHTLEEKKNSQKPPFGVPGLETSLPLMLNAVNEKRLSLERMVELMSTNPRKLFGLSSSEVGEQTYIEVDLEKEWTIKNEDLFTKAGWSPFDGMKVKGRLKKVILRGRLVYHDEHIFGPFGQVIFPNS